MSVGLESLLLSFSDSMADEGFLRTVEELIQVTNDIDRQLAMELKWIENYHAGSVAVETMGATASVIVAGVMISTLALAPFAGNGVQRLNSK